MDELTLCKMENRFLRSAVHAQERWLPDIPPLSFVLASGKSQLLSREFLEVNRLYGKAVYLRSFDADAVVAAYPLGDGATRSDGFFLSSTSGFYEPFDIPLQGVVSVCNLSGVAACEVVLVTSRRSNIEENQT